MLHPRRMMSVCFLVILIFNLSAIGASPTPKPLRPRGHDETPGRFRNQMKNPSEISAVLLIIGGDIVQKAVAQQSGRKTTFVVLSFGWVAYAFSTLMSAFGDGIFMPVPDTPAAVIVRSSRNRKENGSWVISRLIRDLEMEVDKKMKKNNETRGGLVVTIYKVEAHCGEPTRDRIYWTYFPVLILQLVVAMIPVVKRPLDRDWSILLMTFLGNGLSIISGSLKEYRDEKYGTRKTTPPNETPNDYIITRGNGHPHVFVILGNRAVKNLILDDLAGMVPHARRRTRWFVGVMALLWIVFLIVTVGLRDHSWYLFAVGTIGMTHNTFVAGWSRSPEAHGIPLSNEIKGFGRQVVGKGERGPKVMKVLKEIEEDGGYNGIGLAVRPSFFPDIAMSNLEKAYWSKQEELQPVSEPPERIRILRQEDLDRLDVQLRQRIPANG